MFEQRVEQTKINRTSDRFTERTFWLNIHDYRYYKSIKRH